MRGLHKTDIETLMIDSLRKQKINFTEQFPIRCKYGYILDIAIPDIKLAIECDGEHWHLEENLRDKKRDGVLRKMGWKILRFKGNKIKNNMEECLERVKENINTQVGERGLRKKW